MDRPVVATAVILVSQLADLVTFWITLNVANVPLSREGNPLAVGLYGWAGWSALVVYKVGFTAVLAVGCRALVGNYHRKPWRRPLLYVGVLGAAMTLGFVGAATNVLAALRVT